MSEDTTIRLDIRKIVGGFVIGLVALFVLNTVGTTVNSVAAIDTALVSLVVLILAILVGFGASKLIPRSDFIFEVETDRNKAVRMKELNLEEAQEDRRTVLERILGTYDKLSIEKMSKLLEISDPLMLERWLLRLPKELPIKISGENVIIDQSQLSTDDELSSTIDQLIDSFDSMELSKVGKL